MKQMLVSPVDCPALARLSAEFPPAVGPSILRAAPDDPGLACMAKHATDRANDYASLAAEPGTLRAGGGASEAQRRAIRLQEMESAIEGLILGSR